MGRNTALDLLRLIAVLLVLGRHLEICPEALNPVLHQVTVVWHRGGWVGVDIFFVLSGFLVSGLLFQERLKQNRNHFKRFLIRRSLKIYPAFWVFLIATILINPTLGSPIDQTGLVGEMFSLQNYIGGLWNHTWSLAVEAHFYLVLCILFSLFVRPKQDADQQFNAVPNLCGAIAGFCLILRIHQGLNLTSNPIPHLFGTHFRLDSLMFGVFLSWLWHYRHLANQKLKPYTLILVGCWLLLPAFMFTLETTWWIPVVGVSLFYLGSGALLVGMLKLTLHPGLKLMAIAGQYSYSIYLWHMPVQRWGMAWLTQWLGHAPNWYTYCAIYLIGSFVVGWGAAKIVEYPVLKLRDRLYPSRSPSL